MNAVAKKVGFIAIWSIATVVFVAGGFLAAMLYHFHPSPPASNFPRPADALDAQRQDIRYFRELIALDRSFSDSGRAEAARRLDALESRGAVLDRAHFRVALMQIDALADNAHSKIENANEVAPLELPVRVAAFSDGLYIMRATESYAELLGGRVTAIDGQSVDSVMSKLEKLRGGNAQWRRMYASQYIVLPELLYGIGVAPDMRHSTWTVQTPVGASITKELDAYIRLASEPDVFVTRWLSSEPLSGMGRMWRALQPDRPLPISLVDFDRAFRSLRIPGTCIQLVQLKSNADQGGMNIRQFLSGTESLLKREQPCNVILDLRYDDGGNYLNTYGFARELPTLIPTGAKLVMLTGPATFSAGISTAAFVKHASQQRVTIVGEPVGDRLQFFSEGGRACLPHASLCIAFETGKHDYQHDCSDWNKCFWLNHFFESRVNTLDPDALVPSSFKNWRAGVDAALDRAVALTSAHAG